MFLVPDGDEIEIANAAAGFLAKTMPIERLHGPHSADLGTIARRQVGEMGWFALALPEADGGSGLSAVEHALLFREIGRQCGPIDVLAQVLAAATLGSDNADPLSGEHGAALIVADGDGHRAIGHPRRRSGCWSSRNGGACSASTRSSA